jgi:transposase InsO family protein
MAVSYTRRMSIHMAQSIKEERLRWVLPVIKHEVKLKDTTHICPYGKRTLERWVSAYKKYGEPGLEPQSTRPKTQPNETPIRIKEEVINLRKKTKLCALKLMWRLKKHGVRLHKNTIHKIVKQEGLTRQYRVRKVKRKYIKVPLKPGELLEIDVKYVPKRIDGKRYFQYTAIDCASRWRHLQAYEEQTNMHSIEFLKDVIGIFSHRIRAVKTDNGSIFTNYYLGTNKRSDMTVKTIHAFDEFCRDRGIIHYLIDPGKPAQNGKVERSRRENQEKFYDMNVFTSFPDLQKRLKRWNIYYNNLEHCGLEGKTPNEVLTNVR